MAIGISGWLTEEEDLYEVWGASFAEGHQEAFALKVETEVFLDVGNSIEQFITGSAISYATMEVLKNTAIATAVSALTWPLAIIQMGFLIDNRKARSR